MREIVIWMSATVRLRRFDQAVEIRARLATSYNVREEPTLAPDHERADRILDTVRVKRHPPIKQHPDELRPLPAYASARPNRMNLARSRKLIQERLFPLRLSLALAFADNLGKGVLRAMNCEEI